MLYTSIWRRAKFGGTAIGDGLVLKGQIDLKDVLKHRMPQLDLQFDVKGVDPSSLGFGEIFTMP